MQLGFSDVWSFKSVTLHKTVISTFSAKSLAGNSKLKRNFPNFKKFRFSLQFEYRIMVLLNTEMKKSIQHIREVCGTEEYE